MPTAPFLAPNRDTDFKTGRPKSATTYFSIPGCVMNGGSSSLAYTAGRDHYGPCFVQSPIVVDQFMCEVTVGAAGNLRMGIYRADVDQQPIGAPLLDSGDIAISVAVKTFTPTTPIYLPRGRYLTVWNMSVGSTLRITRGDAANPGLLDTFTANNNINDRYVTRAYAAFPTPGTAWNTIVSGGNVGSQHAVLLRVKTP